MFVTFVNVYIEAYWPVQPRFVAATAAPNVARATVAALSFYARIKRLITSTTRASQGSSLAGYPPGLPPGLQVTFTRRPT